MQKFLSRDAAAQVKKATQDLPECIKTCLNFHKEWATGGTVPMETPLGHYPVGNSPPVRFSFIPQLHQFRLPKSQELSSVPNLSHEESSPHQGEIHLLPEKGRCCMQLREGFGTFSLLLLLQDDGVYHHCLSTPCASGGCSRALSPSLPSPRTG